MKTKVLQAIINLMIIHESTAQFGFGIVGNPLAHARPCEGNDNVSASFESGLPPGEENQYNLNIITVLVPQSRVILKFDSEATLILSDKKKARITYYPRTKEFDVRFFKKAQNLNVQVKGPATGTIPYPTSIEVNGVQFCEKPMAPGYFDNHILGYQDTAETTLNAPDESCGRRKVQHTELIVNGQPSKPGDWPWHVAIYRLDNSNVKYICGGTLISHTFVITAAHCTTIRGAPVLPEILSVIFGKYNLIGGDIATQEREIHQVIVHENFNYRRLDNDIALLKVKSEVKFDDYVQPACIWYGNAHKKLPPGQIYGTVVGWGFDHTEKLSAQLKQVTIPKHSESTCIKSNPAFFTRLLTPEKFCAGFNNGTSACNGDSGGGFSVFVPDVSGDTSSNAKGAWHIRGIVSLSVSRTDIAICDTTQYVLFTDVAKYKGWMEDKIKT